MPASCKRRYCRDRLAEMTPNLGTGLMDLSPADTPNRGENTKTSWCCWYFQLRHAFPGTLDYLGKVH